MVNSMLWDSPTPNAEKGSEKRPEETPAGKLVVPFPDFFVLSLLVFVTPCFSLDPQNQGDNVEKVEETPRTEAAVGVGADTSLVLTPVFGKPNVI